MSEYTYIVAGDAMAALFRKKFPEKKTIPFRDDLSRGVHEGYAFTDSFIMKRAEGFHVPVSDYTEKLDPVIHLDFDKEYILCFGEDDCCRANLEFMIGYLNENHYKYPIRVHIVDERTLEIIKLIPDASL